MQTELEFTVLVLSNTDVVEKHLENPEMALASQITRLLALNRIRTGTDKSKQILELSKSVSYRQLRLN